jgi:hypothetical protein
MAYRIVSIDDLTRKDHCYLTSNDNCYFFGEYTARKGYGYSETNGLIHNLKKKPDRRGKPEWQHKLNAIARVATLFKTSIKPDFLTSVTFVPMPPSKTPDHPDFDDRMHDILKSLGNNLDIRNILKIKHSVEASHLSAQRPTIDDLYDLMHLDDSLKEPAPSNIIVCDDVLTTGAHFIAAKRHLSRAFPNTTISGFFIARRVPEAIDWDIADLDDLEI